MRALLICLFALFLSPQKSAAIEPMEAAAYASVLADMTTTRHGLGEGFVESNPLLGKNPSDEKIALVTAARLVAINRLAHSDLTHRQKRVFLTVLACVGFGAAGANYAVQNGGSQLSGLTVGLTIPLIVFGASE